MKVLYYIHSLGIGGAETIVANYLLQLKQRGVDVVLVEIERRETFLEERLRAAGIKTISMFPYNTSSLPGMIKRKFYHYTIDLKKFWEDILFYEKPDIIHIHTKTKFLKDLEFPASKMVCTIHSEVPMYISDCRKKDTVFLQEKASQGMTFFSLSKRMTSDLREYFGAGRIAYVPNGIDLAYIRKGSYNREQFLSSLGIPKEAFVVGHVGGFRPVKNHKKVIEVFSAVNKKRPDSYLLLVGNGVNSNIKRIKTIVTELDLNNRVLFLGLREDAAAIMGVFDAMVLPSFSESFSLVMIEAQAQGVRCVASTAVPDEVICNPNCFKLSLEEPDEIWADLLLSDSVSESGNSLDAFDINTVVDKICFEYEQLIG